MKIKLLTAVQPLLPKKGKKMQEKNQFPKLGEIILSRLRFKALLSSVASRTSR